MEHAGAELSSFPSSDLALLQELEEEDSASVPSCLEESRLINSISALKGLSRAGICCQGKWWAHHPGKFQEMTGCECHSLVDKMVFDPKLDLMILRALVKI